MATPKSITIVKTAIKRKSVTIPIAILATTLPTTIVINKRNVTKRRNATRRRSATIPIAILATTLPMMTVTSKRSATRRSATRKRSVTLRIPATIRAMIAANPLPPMTTVTTNVIRRSATRKRSATILHHLMIVVNIHQMMIATISATRKNTTRKSVVIPIAIPAPTLRTMIATAVTS